MSMIKSKRTKGVDLLIACIFFLLILICLFPLLNIAAVSLSSPQAIINQKVWLFPVQVTLDAYHYVLNDQAFTYSLLFTVVLTVICTVLSLSLTVICAYPLTQSNLKGRKFFTVLIILTMYFSPGIIPHYLLMRDLGLLDNVLVLMIPNAISVFNVIILKSFFTNIPDSLKESANLDGAGHFTILTKIYMPLSKSVLATLALFYAVGRWNGFADALMYITRSDLEPIQLKLYKIINSLAAIDTNEGIAVAAIVGENMKAATVMFATIPILLIYPWLQRYFITGVTLGAVKE